MDAGARPIDKCCRWRLWRRTCLARAAGARSSNPISPIIPPAALLEDGRVLFDMRTAHYSVGESHGRCLLQLWSDERNLVRTVVDVQQRAQCLRLVTRRMGAAKPQSLELAPTSDRRTPTARDAARRNYLRLLERVLARHFIGAKVDGLRTAMDLEHSFGPAYVRGRLLKGTAADAVIGVGDAESTSTIDGVLTLGILWLDYCRKHADARRHFGGLKVVVPAGAWRTTAERMAWLNHAAADFAIIHPRRAQRRARAGRLSRHRQPGFAARPRIFASSRARALPIRHRSASCARSRCGARARRDSSPLRN